MSAFENTETVLTEDLPDAKAKHNELVVQIAQFQRTWEQFQAIKHQAPAPPPAEAGCKYRTA